MTGSTLYPMITLNDLAKYSPWPRRLLSLESFDVRHKTEKEVLREYQDEKWAQLLDHAVTLRNPTLAQIERFHVDFDVLFPGYENGNFYLTTEEQMLERHLALYVKVLGPYLHDASCLVELGAGFGSKLLRLAEVEEFSGLPLIACEYTQNGRDLISILAAALTRQVAVGHCDFRNMKIEGVVIPENAVIFTSYAAHYVPELPKAFVNFLSVLRPKVVVHFEPCYEHYPIDTVHGLMCRRYVELNDYTRNLATLIEAAVNEEKILARVQSNVLGSNPFLPISVIEWAPAKTKKIFE